MISDAQLVRFHVVGTSITGAVIPRVKGEQWIEEWVAGGYSRERYELLPVNTCRCCGSPDVSELDAPHFRCPRHVARNPCVVEGCRRSRVAPGVTKGEPRLSDDDTVCAEHWRRYVPKGSRLRAVYLAYHRRGKKRGWDRWTIDRYWSFWDRLVARVRRESTEGRLDVVAIDAMFGWETA